jgi:Zn-dependent oligopeptidase
LALEPILDGKGGIRFDHSAEELHSLTEDFLSHAHSTMNDIIDFNGEKRTFENTMIQFSQLDADVTAFSGVLGFYASVAPDKKLRDASNDVTKKFNDFVSAIYTNKKL